MTGGGFYFSFTLGMPIPLDCCPQTFIEEDQRALREYLGNPSPFRSKPKPKPAPEKTE